MIMVAHEATGLKQPQGVIMSRDIIKIRMG